MKLRFYLLCFILFYGLFVLFTSCKKEEEFPYNFTENKGIVGKWIKTEMFDGYANGGSFTWSKVNTEYTDTLQFEQGDKYRQTFPSHTNYRVCIGIYTVTTTDSLIIASNCNVGSYGTKITELTSNTLIIDHQGIEGVIRDKYRAIK